MDLRIGLVGPDQRQTTALAQRIEGYAKAAAAWSTFPVDLDYLVSHGVNAVLVDGTADAARALEAAQFLSTRMEVVLVARETGAEALRAAMRAGCTDLVDPWADPGRLREVLDEIGARVEEQLPEGHVLAVLGCQGGIGATTVTVALAHMLSEDKRRKVIVADMDVTSGDLLAALDMDPRTTTTTDLLRHVDQLDIEKLHNTVQRHAGGFWVLPQPPEDLDSVSMTTDQAHDLLAMLTRSFTDIVVDMGSALGETSRRVALGADNVVLVTTQEVPPLRKAARRLSILRDLGIPSSRVHLVVNRYQVRRFPKVDEIAQQLRHPVTATISNDYATVNEALHAGSTVFEASPRSAVAQDLQVLKARLMGEEVPKVRRGWWGGT